MVQGGRKGVQDTPSDVLMFFLSQGATEGNQAVRESVGNRFEDSGQRSVESTASLNARVAEWQTRWLQVPVLERAWGFKSPLAHDG